MKSMGIVWTDRG